MAKSSLDIPLLPELEQDRHVAMLMRLQGKSAHECKEEKRLDILLRPALPGATVTTFGGLKRQKALNSNLQINHLGIKQRKVGSTITTSSEKNTSDESKQDQMNNSELTNSSKSLALVCEYDSSNSSSESDDIDKGSGLD